MECSRNARVSKCVNTMIKPVLFGVSLLHTPPLVKFSMALVVGRFRERRCNRLGFLLECFAGHRQLGFGNKRVGSRIFIDVAVRSPSHSDKNDSLRDGGCSHFVGVAVSAERESNTA